MRRVTGGHIRKVSQVRLWTLHPKYLDAKGLVALWREGLLARAVLKGATKGYRRHPQLERFRAHQSPLAAINSYLGAVASEAVKRGYSFDRQKIGPVRTTGHALCHARAACFRMEAPSAQTSHAQPRAACPLAPGRLPGTASAL